MMGGSIRVESEPGRGSTFHFTARFGIVQGAKPTNRPKRPACKTCWRRWAQRTAPPQALYVLLAEDNPINQRVAMRLLEKRGHRVALAATGREALEWFDRERFDLILMDVQMPDMDGIETTSVIRQREKQTGGYTPIVALTAHTMKGDRERCLERGHGQLHHTSPSTPPNFCSMAEAAAAAHSSVERAPPASENE